MSDTSGKEKEVTPIGKRREELRITQHDLADMVGVTEVTISNWEKKQPAWLENQIVLAAILDRPLIDFMEPGAVTKWREHANLSRRELARKVGVRQNTVVKWESEGLANLNRLIRLCIAMKCTSFPTILVDFFDKESKPSNVLLSGEALIKAFKTSWKAEKQKDSTSYSGMPEKS